MTRRQESTDRKRQLENSLREPNGPYGNAAVDRKTYNPVSCLHSSVDIPGDAAAFVHTHGTAKPHCPSIRARATGEHGEIPRGTPLSLSR